MAGFFVLGFHRNPSKSYGSWEIPDTRPALDGVAFSKRGRKMAGDIHLIIHRRPRCQDSCRLSGFS
ncbi:hypothetical protein JN853_29110 [Pseudomonas syringae pv. actinidiae ICMP 9853]|nr:hypothetical protein JN853_29110 [Pseudomonas syringae pv. actinidiae ICMP 9853]